MFRSRTSVAPSRRRPVGGLRGLVSLAAVAALFLGTGVGCNQGGKGGSMSVPMKHTPRRSLNTSAFAGMIPENPVYLAPVTDKRPAPRRDKIGEISETPPVPVYPGSDVPEFVHGVLAEQLGVAGVNIVEDQNQADVVLSTELKDFWVQKTGTFRGTVGAVFTVQDKSGRQLWKGPSQGESGNWGLTRNAENYQQVYSNATLQMIENLLNNYGFRNALAGKSSGTGGGPAGAGEAGGDTGDAGAVGTPPRTGTGTAPPRTGTAAPRTAAPRTAVPPRTGAAPRTGAGNTARPGGTGTGRTSTNPLTRDPATGRTSPPVGEPDEPTADPAAGTEEPMEDDPGATPPDDEGAEAPADDTAAPADDAAAPADDAPADDTADPADPSAAGEAGAEPDDELNK